MMASAMELDWLDALFSAMLYESLAMVVCETKNKV